MRINIKIKLIFFIIILILSKLQSQEKKSDFNFSSPVDIPTSLTGNFGELRPFHYHAGLDIKTNFEEGYVVKAIADGYVFRILIMNNGYGKALFIKHPNGMVSVYGHLQGFNDTISKVVKFAQYKKEKFSLDLYLSKHKLPVHKGDMIALSGNSGSSAGPHLHFELRDSSLKYYINPHTCKFEIHDTISPKIYKIAICPIGSESVVKKNNTKQIFNAVGKNGNYTLTEKNPISVFGKIGFQIKTKDFINDSWNNFGINSLELFCDNICFYKIIFDKFSIDENRTINSIIDFDQWVRYNEFFYKTYTDRNNHASIIKQSKNNGIFEFTDNKIHDIKLCIKDVYENSSIITFKVISNNSDTIGLQVKTTGNYVMAMPYNKENQIVKDDIRIILKKNTLFDTLYFKYSRQTPPPGYYSEVHHVHNIFSPLYQSYTLSIKPDSLPEFLNGKALIAEMIGLNQIRSIGGEYKDGFVSAMPITFGNFVVAVDTVAPEITSLKFPVNNDFSKYYSISLKISDNLSGISSYEAFIDDVWVLFDYDLKSNSITHFFDQEKTVFGKNHLLLIKILDNKNNSAIYNLEFFK